MVLAKKTKQATQKQPQRIARGGYVAERARDNPPSSRNLPPAVGSPAAGGPTPPSTPTNPPQDHANLPSQKVLGEIAAAANSAAKSTSPYTLARVKGDSSFRVVTADGMKLTAQQATQIPIDNRAIMLGGEEDGYVVFPNGAYYMVGANKRVEMEHARRWAEFEHGLRELTRGCSSTSDNCKDPEAWKAFVRDLTTSVPEKVAKGDPLDPRVRASQCIEKACGGEIAYCPYWQAYHCAAHARTDDDRNWFGKMIDRLMLGPEEAAQQAADEARFGAQR